MYVDLHHSEKERLCDFLLNHFNSSNCSRSVAPSVVGCTYSLVFDNHVAAVAADSGTFPQVYASGG